MYTYVYFLLCLSVLHGKPLRISPTVFSDTCMSVWACSPIRFEDRAAEVSLMYFASRLIVNSGPNTHACVYHMHADPTLEELLVLIAEAFRSMDKTLAPPRGTLLESASDSSSDGNS